MKHLDTKMRAIIVFLLACFGFLPAFAQAVTQEDAPLEVLGQGATICDLGEDEISQMICENSSLRASYGALESVWSTWDTGINGDRIDYLREEQREWLAARDECLEEVEPQSCLQSRFEERVQILTQPRIFQSEKQIDGKSYLVFSAMTPLTYKGLNIEKALAELNYSDEVSQSFKARINETIDEECNLCSYENVTQLDLGYDGSNLAVIEEQMVETFDEQDPTYHYRSYYFDKAGNELIEFSELFEDASAPFAKNALIENIIGQLTDLNNAVAGNENGQTRYFWNETETNLQSQDNVLWSQMGWCPEVENGKIMGFKYRADSYEFAPYGSSEYFSGFYIDAAPITAYLKPKYRENFN